jgi:DNA polymerase
MKLEKLKQKIEKCNQCELAKTRNKAVSGVGSGKAEIMFIGEGPGKKEDLQGEPFVGASGKLLDSLLKQIDSNRKDVFIANVVKCRPPNNRDPRLEEIKACWPWLEKQIEVIKPKLIVTLGRHSLNRFVPGAVIGECRGKILKKKINGLGEIVLFPCYHPAAALYNGSLKKVLEADFVKISKALKLIKKKN